FGLESFTFYQLYQHLLNRSLTSYRRISHGASIRLLQTLIAQSTLEYFSPIAEKIGFVQLLANFIEELKQSFVQPEDFKRFAQTPKDRDLALLYETYQTYLIKHQLVDREGAGWLAYQKIKPHHLQDVGLLVIDGFQSISPLQAKLLGKIIASIPDVLITLTQVPNPRPVHRIFVRTYERLLRFVPTLSEQSSVFIDQNTARHPTLTYLVHNFYTFQKQKVTNRDAIWMIEAPDFLGEVQGTLRQIKTLLLDGEKPNNIIIVARNLQLYDDLLQEFGEAYQVPLIFRRGLPLKQNPAIRAIMLLLSLSTNDFTRVEVLDTLQSPYFRIPSLEEGDIDAIAKIALKEKVMQSTEQWQEAIEQAQLENKDEDGEIIDPLAVPEGLALRLASFFEHITPPESGSVNDYIAWIESILGPDPESLRELDEENASDTSSSHLHFFPQVRSHPTVLVRDLEALHGFWYCLREILEGHRVVDLDEVSITWSDFHKTLQATIEQARAQSYNNNYRRQNVLVTTIFEGRGMHHDHVFILGLSEGIFPAIRLEDPLYSDRERQAFNHFAQQETLDYSLLTTSERYDDTSLFFECMAMARKTLTLTRPTLNEKAEPLPPSILWRYIEDIVEAPNVIKYRVGKPPTIQEAATLREAEVALISMYGDRPIPEAWMQNYPSQRWNIIQHGIHIENNRENPYYAFDHYAGILRDPVALEYVKQTLSPARKWWSASQFNDLGYCPFRFFAKRMLKLDELREPEEGLDALQLGNIQHELLEITYEHVRQQGWPIAPEYCSAAQDYLEEIAPDILEQAPRKYRFRRSRYWEYEKREIIERLKRFIQADFAGSPDDNPYQNPKKFPINTDHPRYVYRLELPFGMDGYPPAYIDAARTIQARGYIDRIDRVGDQYIVIDYKSGITLPNNQDIEDGRNFQMVLYLQAAEQTLNLEDKGRIVGGYFWSLYNRKFNGALTINDATELINEAIKKLESYIIEARKGRFPEQPSKREDGKCTRYCEFYKLCRIQRTRFYEG
ncbi:MAG: hypothetical protein CUN55_03250, partial [Phototrophicales bacterium]